MLYYPDIRKHGETLEHYLKRMGVTPREHIMAQQRYWAETFLKRRKKLNDHLHYCKPQYHQKRYVEHYWIHNDSPKCYYDEEATWSNLYKQCEEHLRVKRFPRKPKFARLPKFPRVVRKDGHDIDCDWHKGKAADDCTCGRAQEALDLS